MCRSKRFSLFSELPFRPSLTLSILTLSLCFYFALVSQATYISPETIGTNFAPGIWSPEQIAGWKLVTDAVHSKGGYIYCQLWHIGRIAHASFNEHHLVKGSGYQVNRSASDIPQEGETNTTLDGSMQPHVKPVPFTIEDIARLRKDYVHAVRSSKPQAKMRNIT